jgi:hypothetical protein
MLDRQELAGCGPMPGVDPELTATTDRFAAACSGVLSFFVQ